jgi:hypothetical protein
LESRTSARERNPARQERLSDAFLDGAGRERKVRVGAHPGKRVADRLGVRVVARLRQPPPEPSDSADSEVGGCAQARDLERRESRQGPVEEREAKGPVRGLVTHDARTARGSGCRAACQVPRRSGIETASPTQKKRTIMSAARMSGGRSAAASAITSSGSYRISVPPPSSMAIREHSSTCTSSSIGKRAASAVRSTGARHSKSARSAAQHATPVRCS